MRSTLPKMLHPLLGRTLLGHVLAATRALGAERSVVVVGHGADQVTDHLAEIAPDVTPVLQTDQRGTGHAARVALEAVGIIGETVVIVNGDMPLLRSETLTALVEAHEAEGAAATILTAEVTNPYGLGRILRNPSTGAVDAIVEERDATPAQRAIREINAGLYAFDAGLLAQALGKLTTNNEQGEEYITDVIGLLVDSGCVVSAHAVDDASEVLGCNDRVELAALGARLRDRVNAGWMREGVTIVDPTTTWIDVMVGLGRDAVLEPNTYLRGHTRVGEGAVIGPDTTLIDVYVAEGAHVVRAHAVGATIGPRASIGPYAYLRPGTVLHEGSKVGTFVEVKNSEVGPGTKIPHLSYVGDATIGEQTNIGAATVVVNYDGQAKHRTVIGSFARTGADNMFVAPVEVGDGAYTAAGSVITSNVPPGALGVGRAPQRNIEGWVERKRAGSTSAAAAAAARVAGATQRGELTQRGEATQYAEGAEATLGAEADVMAQSAGSGTLVTQGVQGDTVGADGGSRVATREIRTASSQPAVSDDPGPGDTSSD
jgi:bifunctional UDP-N-acetylglucosamine pyrophosphorylase/glucosamine-1-phosphate N-acetyltransferase